MNEVKTLSTVISAKLDGSYKQAFKQAKQYKDQFDNSMKNKKVTDVFKNMSVDIKKVNMQLKTANASVNKFIKSGVSGFKNFTSSIGSSIIKVVALTTALSAGLMLVNNELREDYSQSIKLATIMRQRNNATYEQVMALEDYARIQRDIGIIDDGVTRAGLQQLATFTNTNEALMELTPAMNNLLAQQKGFNAAESDAVSIGNLMGKVMQGQTSALTRVGVTFSAAEEQVLKYGTEVEKAAMLAKVIKNNVGDMNTVLGATPYGRIQQLRFAFDDLKDSIALAFQPLIQWIVPYLQIALQYLTNIFNTLGNFFSAVFGKVDWSSPYNEIGKISGAIGNVTDETEEAQSAMNRWLGSFDKINNMTFGSATAQTPVAGGGISGGDFGYVAEELEISAKMQALADKVKKVFNDISTRVQKFKTDFGNKISEAFIRAGKAISGFISGAWSFFLGIWDNGGDKIFANLLVIISDIITYFGRLGEAIWNVFNPENNAVVAFFVDKLAALSEWLAADNVALETLLTTSLAVIGGMKLFGGITTIISGLSTAFTTLGAKIPAIGTAVTTAGAGIKTALGSIGAAIGGVSAGTVAAVAGIVVAVGAALVYLYNNSETFRNFIITIVSSIWEVIKSVLGVVQNAIEVAWNFIFTIFQVGFEFISGFVNIVASLLTGDFVGAFEYAKEMVGNIFTSIGEFISSTIQSILSAFGSLWDGVKNIWNKLKDLFGSKQEITVTTGRHGSGSVQGHFANGGEITHRGIYELGENGRETVIPSGYNNIISDLAKKLTETMNSGTIAGNTYVDVNVELDGDKVTKKVEKNIQKNKARRTTNPVFA